MATPITADNWRSFASCRLGSGYDAELWFPVGTSGPAMLQAAEAKSVCATCPVRSECLADALARGLDDGIFGGLDEDERRLLKRRDARRRQQAARVTAIHPATDADATKSEQVA